ncbi:putative enzyme yhhN [Yersinia mollaretii]|nr:putative enzyme yhhN [Yersinia mollaretii]CQJ25301.1 putative enzyme yhhN [Yersinia mollaretii]
MSWPFLAVFFSGWLFVDATYRGPRWQRWVFKPVTLLLLLLLAWQAPTLGPMGYLIVLGLLATLAADALLLLPSERLLYALGAFFLSHLLYTISFASQMTFTLFWPLPLVLIIIGVLLLTTIWTKLDEMRWPVVALVGMTLLMVWMAGEQYFARSTDLSFSLLAGTVLLLISHSI